jgi:hypothetical protein
MQRSLITASNILEQPWRIWDKVWKIPKPDILLLVRPWVTLNCVQTASVVCSSTISLAHAFIASLCSILYTGLWPWLCRPAEPPNYFANVRYYYSQFAKCPLWHWPSKSSPSRSPGKRTSVRFERQSLTGWQAEVFFELAPTICIVSLGRTDITFTPSRAHLPRTHQLECPSHLQS